jgi:hypothetical protein
LIAAELPQAVAGNAVVYRRSFNRLITLRA